MIIYYALLLWHDNRACLVKVLDGDKVLASAPFAWKLGKSYTLTPTVNGSHLSAQIDGRALLPQRERPVSAHCRNWAIPTKGCAVSGRRSPGLLRGERMVHRLLIRLGEKDRLARFLVVVGPSGSGKSSLVKVGLVPALWRGELPGQAT